MMLPREGDLKEGGLSWEITRPDLGFCPLKKKQDVVLVFRKTKTTSWF